ncbi:hypothetical protein Brms1b_004221 [Colletotrichum noveboracense]|nr:hypothetical protein Brms1b_004221 [Colletotrichum noveboracense]
MPNVRYPFTRDNSNTLIIDGHREMAESHPGENLAVGAAAGLKLAGLEVFYKELTHQEEEDRQKDKDLEAVTIGDISANATSLHKLKPMGEMRKSPPADTTTPVSAV